MTQTIAVRLPKFASFFFKFFSKFCPFLKLFFLETNLAFIGVYVECWFLSRSLLLNIAKNIRYECYFDASPFAFFSWTSECVFLKTKQRVRKKLFCPMNFCFPSWTRCFELIVSAFESGT